MPQVVKASDVEKVTGALLGGIAVDDGPADPQLAVLRAIVDCLWERPDLALDAVTPLTAAEAGATLTDAGVRRRTLQLLVLLELCRHPETATQVARVDEYAAA